MRVQAQGVVHDFKTTRFGHGVLPLFNLGIKKFLYFAAVQAHQMVVVLAFVQLVNRFAALEVVAAQDAGLLKLQQHPVHRGQAHVRTFFQQNAVNVFGRQMAWVSLLENFQYLQARQGGFEAGVFQVVNRIHGELQYPLALNKAIATIINHIRPFGYHPRPLPSYYPMTTRIPMVYPLLRWACWPLLLVVAACSSFDGASNRVASLVSPYKIDVVQGNFVAREQAEALKPGMSRIQVRDILGSPLLVSVFHADRWDYMFTFRRQGLAPQARKVTVYFKGDALERFEADSLPSEAEFVTSLDSGRSLAKAPVLQATPEALAKFAADAKPQAPVAETKPLPPLPDRYPPLEPSTR